MLNSSLRDAVVLGLTIRYGARLTRKQAAEALNFSCAQIDHRVKQGRLTPYYDGDTPYFLPEQILDYRESSHVEIQNQASA